MAAGDRNIEDLKSQVIHTLETNGVLGQIRAQLRANVYKAIESDEEPFTVQGPGVRLLKSPQGWLLAEIVAEFLEFYDFRHSLSVFLPETNLTRERRSRSEVAYEAGLGRVRSDASILEQLVDQATGAGLRKATEGYHSSASSTTASSPPPQQHQQQLAAAAAAAAAAACAAPLPTPSTASTRPTSADSAAPVKAEAEAPGGAMPVPPSVGQGAAAARAAAGGQQPAAGGGARGAAAGPGAANGSGGAADEVAEEPSGRERRKPLGGKLPSLNSSASSHSGAAGKDLLPPLRAEGHGSGPLLGSGSQAMSAGLGHPASSLLEEVSLGEASFGMSRDSMDDVREDIDRLQHIDRQIASLSRGAAPNAVGLPAAPPAPETTHEAEGEEHAAPPQHLGAPEVTSAQSTPQASAGPAGGASASLGSMPGSPAGRPHRLASVSHSRSGSPSPVQSPRNSQPPSPGSAGSHQSAGHEEPLSVHSGSVESARAALRPGRGVGLRDSRPEEVEEVLSEGSDPDRSMSADLGASGASDPAARSGSAASASAGRSAASASASASHSGGGGGGGDRLVRRSPGGALSGGPSRMLAGRPQVEEDDDDDGLPIEDEVERVSGGGSAGLSRESSGELETYGQNNNTSEEEF